MNLETAIIEIAEEKNNNIKCNKCNKMNGKQNY